MPSKYQVITEMEAEHLRTLTVDTKIHYMDFYLTTAANNFKYYSFPGAAADFRSEA